MGTGSFPGVKSGRGVTLTPHPLLVPWSRKSRGIFLLPLWAVRPVQSLSACTRMHFTFLPRFFENVSTLCVGKWWYSSCGLLILVPDGDELSDSHFGCFNPMKEPALILGQEAGETHRRSGPWGKEKNVCPRRVTAYTGFCTLVSYFVAYFSSRREEKVCLGANYATWRFNVSCSYLQNFASKAFRENTITKPWRVAAVLICNWKLE